MHQICNQLLGNCRQCSSLAQWNLEQSSHHKADCWLVLWLQKKYLVQELVLVWQAWLELVDQWHQDLVSSELPVRIDIDQWLDCWNRRMRSWLWWVMRMQGQEWRLQQLETNLHHSTNHDHSQVQHLEQSSFVDQRCYLVCNIVSDWSIEGLIDSLPRIKFPNWDFASTIVGTIWRQDSCNSCWCTMSGTRTSWWRTWTEKGFDLCFCIYLVWLDCTCQVWLYFCQSWLLNRSVSRLSRSVRICFVIKMNQRQ